MMFKLIPLSKNSKKCPLTVILLTTNIANKLHNGQSEDLVRYQSTTTVGAKKKYLMGRKILHKIVLKNHHFYFH